MPLVDSTRHNIALHSMLRPGDRVVVAVSGGQDSLCLLHVLMRLGGELGVTLHVAHLNHGLRGAESDADARFVAETAAEWGIGATIETADVKAYRAAHHLSLEDAARPRALRLLAARRRRDRRGGHRHGAHGRRPDRDDHHALAAGSGAGRPARHGSSADVAGRERA